MPQLTEGTVYLCMFWLEDVMYFHHRSVQLGNHCTIPPTNPNLSKFTSVYYSSKQFLMVVCRLIFSEVEFLFMYKIQGKLGLLKWEQENQNNSNFVWKMVSSGTADTAQAWDSGVRSLGHPFSLQCQSKKKRKTKQTTKKSPNKRTNDPKAHPETRPKHY